MKYFAQINDKNIVSEFLVLGENKNKDWLVENFGGTWVESTEAQKNRPGIGFTYDSELDAFIPPKRFDSWVLDEETAQWEAPVEYPTDGKNYFWDEKTTSWVEIPQDGE